MEAVKAAEPAAVTGGISAIRGKLSHPRRFCASGWLGGVLLVTYDQHVTNTTYTTPVGLVWLATVVLWGIRRPSGAIAVVVTGTLFTGFLASGFHFSFISWTGTTSPYVPSVLFGLGAVVMAQNPDGLLSLHEQSMAAPAPTEHGAAPVATGGLPARAVPAVVALVNWPGGRPRSRRCDTTGFCGGAGFCRGKGACGDAVLGIRQARRPDPYPKRAGS